jgi:hypothetical protein
VQAKLVPPAHDASDWRAAAGSSAALRHGQYRPPDVDLDLVIDRLDALAPRVQAIRERQVRMPGARCGWLRQSALLAWSIAPPAHAPHVGQAWWRLRLRVHRPTSVP